jgi:RNA polymerase sigma-70 factor, ECF subfamily
MAITLQELSKLTGFATWAAVERLEHYEEIYEQNRHRVYALAFWMTDNEMAAEDVMASVFQRAFALHPTPSAEAIDRALIAELREITALGVLTLTAPTTTQVMEVRRNTMRVHLERAVVQLPPTERMIFLLHDVEQYEHPRIAHMLGVNERESEYGLHQARLRVRQLVAAMQDEARTQN